MNREDEERNIQERAGDLLDERLEELDEETLARLHAARRSALDALDTRRHGWMTVGGWAAAAASLLLVVSLWDGGERMPESPDVFEDLELLSTKEDMEFIEDLDFYLWLEDEQQTG